MRRRVYIAGPITKGPLADNINRASEAAISLMRAGLAPLCPHWSCFAGGAVAHMSGQVVAVAEVLPAGTVHEDWYGIDLPWVAVADAVLRLPGESRGADLEVAEAQANGVPVFHSVAEVIAWNAGERDDPKASFSLRSGRDTC